MPRIATATPLSIAGLLSCCSLAAAYNGSFQSRWVNSGLVATSPTVLTTAQPAVIGVSFVTDGAIWDDDDASLGGNAGPSSLNASLARALADDDLLSLTTADIDYGRELLRQAASLWARDSGLVVIEVADSGTAREYDTMTSFPSVRFGGLRRGDDPNPGTASDPHLGGDIWFNTAFLDDELFNGTDGMGAPLFLANDSAQFINVAIHEIGHALGLEHPTPGVNVAAMEPGTGFFVEHLPMGGCGRIWTPGNGTGRYPSYADEHFRLTHPQPDDLRAIHRLYGDRYAGVNNAPSTPVNLGAVDVAGPFYEPMLSLNGQVGGSTAHVDYFRFTTSNAFTVYLLPRDDGDELTAGDLAMQVKFLDAFGSPQAFTIDNGSSQELFASGTIGIAPNTEVHVSIYDSGPNDPDDGIVQLYDLIVMSNAAPATHPAPRAWAGLLNKRVAVGQRAYFMGNIGSVVFDPTKPIQSSASSPAANDYRWDINDGTGTTTYYEPVVSHTFPSTGVFSATLTVTDASSRSHTAAVSVTVYDPTDLVVYGANITRMNPNDSLALVIYGEGFDGVTHASDVEIVTWNGSSFVADSDFSVSGSPSVAGDGSSISGLTLAQTHNALAPSPVGMRSIRVTTPSGSHVAVDAIAFNWHRLDVDRSGSVDTDDFDAFAKLIPNLAASVCCNESKDCGQCNNGGFEPCDNQSTPYSECVRPCFTCTPYYATYNFNSDCIIDFSDFELFAMEFMKHLAEQ